MAKEMITPTVDIDSMIVSDQEVCEWCSAKGEEDYYYFTPYCKLANLEITKNKIPTVEEAEIELIELHVIPNICPNKYISTTNLPLSNRKIE